MKTGTQLIAEERERQIAQEGWTPQHDDAHHDGTLTQAAACYALPQIVYQHRFKTERPPHLTVGYPGPDSLTWPWEEKWWKPSPGDRIRNLVKAGALIAAEIDRLQRATPTP